MTFKHHSHDALLIIDMQKDFLSNGALPVAGGDELIPLINQQVQTGFSTIIASRDWHPSNHCSFKSAGGLWPPHCIAGTKGAELDPRLRLPSSVKIFDKGMNCLTESYSAFKDESGRSTGMAEYLESRHVKRVYLCGIALDYCVKDSALDSVKAGFETHLLVPLTRAINDPASTLAALKLHHVIIE